MTRPQRVPYTRPLTDRDSAIRERVYDDYIDAGRQLLEDAEADLAEAIRRYENAVAAVEQEQADSADSRQKPDKDKLQLIADQWRLEFESDDDDEGAQEVNDQSPPKKGGSSDEGNEQYDANTASEGSGVGTDADDGDDEGEQEDEQEEGKKKGRRSKGSFPKSFGADESSGSSGGRSVFEGVVGGFGPWVNPGRQGRGRSAGGGRVLETRDDLAPWVYGDPRGDGRSGGRGALRDVGLDPWTNPKRDDDYGDGGRGAFPVDPGTDPVAGFRNVARASGSSQSSLALAMGINPATLEEFE